MLEAQIMKAWRDYENSNYMNTKALNKYIKLTDHCLLFYRAHLYGLLQQYFISMT